MKMPSLHLNSLRADCCRQLPPLAMMSNLHPGKYERDFEVRHRPQHMGADSGVSWPDYGR